MQNLCCSRITAPGDAHLNLINIEIVGRLYMSTLLDRDSNLAEPSPYAPKWVRDAAHAERHDVEWIAAARPQVNAATQSPTDLKRAFEQFVENYTASTGKRTISAREREVLFKKFQQFLDAKKSTQSAR